MCTVADVCAILVLVLSRPTGGAGGVGHGLIFCSLLMSEITKADVCKHKLSQKKKKKHCCVIRGQPLQDWSFISLAESGDNVELNKHSDLHSQRAQFQILSFRTHSAAGDHGIGLVRGKSCQKWTNWRFVFFPAGKLSNFVQESFILLHFKWLEPWPGLLVIATWCTCGQCKFVSGWHYFLIPQF